MLNVTSSAQAVENLRPLWIPPDVDFDTLPYGLQLAITEFISPAYRALVLEADSPLAKSMGMTYVHTFWLELLSQHDLGQTMARLLPRGESSSAHQEAIGRHMRLVGAKEKSAKFLLRLQSTESRNGGSANPLF